MLWILRKALYRAYQFIMKGVVTILRFPVPELFTGAGSLGRLPEAIKSQGVDHVFVVTDKGLMAAGLGQRLLDALEENKIAFTLYDEVQPNPTIQGRSMFLYPS